MKDYKKGSFFVKKMSLDYHTFIIFYSFQITSRDRPMKYLPLRYYDQQQSIKSLSYSKVVNVFLLFQITE